MKKRFEYKIIKLLKYCKIVLKINYVILFFLITKNKETELDRALAVSVFGQCKMEHCKKARVRNPRTSKFHEYCSLRCKNSHKNLLEERMYLKYICILIYYYFEKLNDINEYIYFFFSGKKEKRTSIVGTFAMDLIVALEMSRLQMIKDAQQKKRYYIFICTLIFMFLFYLHLKFVHRSENEEASCSKNYLGE